MAETLTINLSVKRKGFENIDKLKTALKSLNGGFSLGNLVKSDKDAKKLSNTLDNIGVIVKRIADGINSFSSALQVSNSNIQTTDRIAAGLASRVENIASKGVALGGVLGLIALEMNGVLKITNFLGGALQNAFSFFSNAFVGNFVTLIDNINLLGFSIDLATNNVVGLNSVFALLGVSGVTAVGAIVGALGGFSVLKFLSGEFDLFFRRIFLGGSRSLTIFEKFNRTFSIFDESINRTFSNLGQGLQLFGFSALSFFQPLLFVIPAANSLIDLISQNFQRTRDRILGGLGSTSSAIKSLITEGAKILVTILPAVDKLVKGFTSLSEAGEKADKSIAKGQSSKIFETLSKSNLPLFAQLQLFFKEARDFLGSLLSRVDTLAVTIQKVFGLSNQEIKRIESNSKGLVSSLTSNIKGFESQLKSAIRPLKFAEKLDESLKGFFSIGNSPIFGLIKKIGGGLFGANKPDKQIEDIKKGSIQLESVFARIEKILQRVTIQLEKISLNFNKLNKSNNLSNLTKAPKLQTVPFSRSEKPVGGGQVKDLSNLRKQLSNIEKTGESVGKTLQRSFRSEAAPVIKQFLIELGKAEKKFNGFTGIVQGIGATIERGGSLEKILGNFKKIGSQVNNTNIKLKSLELRKITSDFQQFSKEAGKSIDKGLVEQFGKALSNFEGSNFSRKLVTLISKGIRENTPEAEKAVDLLAKVIAAYFPQSPPKRGALRTIEKSGGLIPRMLGESMLKNINFVRRAADKLADMIANFFPRSLPRLGALKGLVKAGSLIPSLLADGIKLGSKSAINAVSTVSDKIFSRITDIANLAEQARRSNVSIEIFSNLDNVLRSVNSSANELTFAFTRITEAVQGNIEQQDELEKVGINVAAIKDSVQPSIEAVLQLANIIETTGIQSNQSTRALRAFGLSAQSNVVNLLLRGRDGIVDLIKESANLGLTIDNSFAKTAIALRRVQTNVDAVKTSLFDNFLRVIAPELEKSSSEFLQFIKQNSTRIGAFVQNVGRIVNGVTKVITKFVQLAIKSPTEAVQTVKNIFSSLGQFVLDIFGIVTKSIDGRVTTFLKDTGNIVVNFVQNFANGLFRDLTELTKLNLRLLGNIATDLFFRIMKGFPPIVFSILNTLFIELPSFIGKSIKELFLGVGKQFSGEIKTLIAGATNEISKFAEKSPAANVLLRSLGFGAIIDGTKLIKMSSKDAAKSLEKSSDEIKKSLEKIKRSAEDSLAKRFSFLAQVDIDKSETQEQIAKVQKRLSSSFVDLIKKTQEDVKRAQESSGGALDSITNEERFKEAEKAVERLFQNLSNSIQDPELKKATEELFADLKFESFDEIMSQLEQLKKSVKEDLPKASGIATNKLNDLTIAFGKNAEKQKMFFESVFDTLPQTLNTIFELSKGELKEFFFASRAVAIAQGTIDVAQAFLKTIGATGFFGIAQAGIATAAATAQLGQIIATSIPGFKEGGFVGNAFSGLVTSGAGPGIDDNLIRVSKKEFVNPPDSVDYYGVGVFEALRRKAIPKDALQNLTNALPPITAPNTSNFRGGGFTGNAIPAQENKGDVTVAVFINQGAFSEFLQSKEGQNAIGVSVDNMQQKKTTVRRR